jgi:hypothetical protein
MNVARNTNARSVVPGLNAISSKLSSLVSGTNRNVGMNVGTNVGMNVGQGRGTGGFLSGWGSLVLVVLILMVVFSLYYQTIGYYFQLGWERLGWSRAHNEKIQIDMPGGASAWLDPVGGGGGGAGGGGAGGAPFGTGLENAVNRLESDVEKALGSDFGSEKQVFNINRNLYTFSEAEPLCRAFGAELATYDQVKDAYKAGADWCNYGWTKGQLALYPTQQATFDKLQAGPEDERMSCGVPGVNGGYFPNEEQRFGVNCYGPRPAETALDQRLQMEENSDFAYDKEVSKFRAERDSIGVNPWSHKRWSA